jgi:hypothetical protein
MNTELSPLIEALRRALRESVAPELQTDFARGQLAAVLDILGKLAEMTVWDPVVLRAQVHALRTGCERFEAVARDAGEALPLFEVPRDAEPEVLLRAWEARTRSLDSWLDGRLGVLAEDLATELDAILRQALRSQLLVQRERIPLTDFGAMTAATSRKDG